MDNFADNVLKIYNMNLAVGMKLEDFKTEKEKEVFKLFDCNRTNGVIDSFEAEQYQIYKKNFFEVTPKEIEEIKFLTNNWNNEEKLKQKYKNADIVFNEKNTEIKIKDTCDTFIISEDRLIKIINGQRFEYFNPYNYFVEIKFSNKENFGEEFCSIENVVNGNFDGIQNAEVYSSSNPLECCCDMIQGKDGKVLSVDTGDVYQISSDLYKAFSAKMWGIIPTTDTEILENIMKKITSDNVLKIISSYTQEAKETLIDSILSETDYNLSKDKKREYIKHIFSCLKEKIPNLGNVEQEFNKELEVQLSNILSDSEKLDKLLRTELSKVLTPQKRGSKIDNNFYTGKEYNVEIQGNIISITDPETKKITNIDAEKLCGGFGGDKFYMMELFKTLPAEVLLDMKNRLNLTNNIFAQITNYIGGSAGHYNPFGRWMYLDEPAPRSYVLVHEFGHAMDFCKNPLGFSVTNMEFVEAYKQEREKYLEGGHEIEEVYATNNSREMFAECYCLLMLGRGKLSNETIMKTYFPKTLECVRKYIETVRAQVK